MNSKFHCLLLFSLCCCMHLCLANAINVYWYVSRWNLNQYVQDNSRLWASQCGMSYRQGSKFEVAHQLFNWYETLLLLCNAFPPANGSLTTDLHHFGSECRPPCKRHTVKYASKHVDFNGYYKCIKLLKVVWVHVCFTPPPRPHPHVRSTNHPEITATSPQTPSKRGTWLKGIFWICSTSTSHFFWRIFTIIAISTRASIADEL